MNKNVLVIGAVVLFLIIGFFGFCMMKKFAIIGLEEQVDTQWANVESVYQRRLDLIPNLVATVKAAAEHERGTHKEVTEARNELLEAQRLAQGSMKGGNAAELQKHFQRVAGATKSLLKVSVEAYPDLKANENFLTLQSQLEGTENRISVERRRFNESVGEYNTMVRKWGGMPLCGGFEKRERFEAEGGAEKAPKVDFNKK